MQQIADWLKKLGMSEYAQLFADNSIDDVSRHCQVNPGWCLEARQAKLAG